MTLDQTIELLQRIKRESTDKEIGAKQVRVIHSEIPIDFEINSGYEAGGALLNINLIHPADQQNDLVLKKRKWP